MSLTNKRILGFFIFLVFSWMAAGLFFVVPLSILAVRADPTGSGSGFFIAIVLVVAPLFAAVGAVIAAFVALRIIDRTLKATTRSRQDYATILIAAVVSSLIATATTYLLAWIAARVLESA